MTTTLYITDLFLFFTVGNYSALTFKFKLRREIGYYVMDYFLPSMFLVATSWVTFWLQADASAPRAVLGTTFNY